MNNISPRYHDLFEGMLLPDNERADAAYDAILFDRHLAVPALIDQYNSSEDNDIMRYLCVQLLGFSDSDLAIDTVITALDDPKAIVRREACFAIENLKAIDALNSIKRRMQDLDTSVREVASEVYKYLKRLRK